MSELDEAIARVDDVSDICVDVSKLTALELISCVEEVALHQGAVGLSTYWPPHELAENTRIQMEGSLTVPAHRRQELQGVGSSYQTGGGRTLYFARDQHTMKAYKYEDQQYIKLAERPLQAYIPTAPPMTVEAMDEKVEGLTRVVTIRDVYKVVMTERSDLVDEAISILENRRQSLGLPLNLAEDHRQFLDTDQDWANVVRLVQANKSGIFAMVLAQESVIEATKHRKKMTVQEREARDGPDWKLVPEELIDENGDFIFYDEPPTIQFNADKYLKSPDLAYQPPSLPHVPGSSPERAPDTPEDVLMDESSVFPANVSDFFPDVPNLT
ncbi:hypothetical protein MMC25_002014 [Agyrium rufum]|nr:hypothetical protein [Agyrium rufum]